MNVTEYLKTIEKTKSELATDLNVSRPTLNHYIDLFESGSRIENERYEIIFGRLFSNMRQTREQFDKQMNSVKFLLERDKKYDVGNLKPGAADMVAHIHNNLVRDMCDDQWDRKVYDAILIFLRNYRTNKVIKVLASYFSDLNSDSDLSNLSDDYKAFYSCFYKFLRTAPIYNKGEFEDFLGRREEIKNEKEQLRNERKKNIQKRMTEVMGEVEREFNAKGIEASEEEMMTEVVRRMKQ